jgi:HEAT repeat protein
MDKPMVANTLSETDRLRMKKLAKTTKVVRAALAPLVEQATDPDEPRRQAAVDNFLATYPPDYLALLAQRLAEVFAHDRVPVRRRAAASLVQLGAPAAPALVVAFVATDRAVIQHEAAELLGEIGPGLSQDERAQLIGPMNLLLAEALDPSVRQKLMHVMGRLCMVCIKVRVARERAEEADPGRGERPVGEQERPGEAADSRIAEQAGLQ